MAPGTASIREERLTTVFMIQLLPNNTNDFRDKFTASIYQALLD